MKNKEFDFAKMDSFHRFHGTHKYFLFFRNRPVHAVNEDRQNEEFYHKRNNFRIADRKAFPKMAYERHFPCCKDAASASTMGPTIGLFTLKQ